MALLWFAYPDTYVNEIADIEIRHLREWLDSLQEANTTNSAIKDLPKLGQTLFSADFLLHPRESAPSSPRALISGKRQPY